MWSNGESRSTMINLVELGWNPFFIKHFEEFAQRKYVPARVVREHTNIYVVYGESGEFVAEVSGKMLHDTVARADCPNTKIKTSTTTVTGTSFTADDDHVILVDDDTAGSTVTVTLPAAASNDGLEYHVKKLGTTADVIVDGNAAETIDGALTQTITTQYDSIFIVCDGSNWHII